MFHARLESIMILDFPMTHGEFNFCDGTIESSIGLHGLDKVVFVEDGQHFWLKIVLYAIEMQHKFIQDWPVCCFIIHLWCMFDSFSMRRVRYGILLFILKSPRYSQRIAHTLKKNMFLTKCIIFPVTSLTIILMRWSVVATCPCSISRLAIPAS